jgi:hypothetical protein
MSGLFTPEKFRSCEAESIVLIKKAILLRTMAKICKRMQQKKTREQFFVVVRTNIKGY